MKLHANAALSPNGVGGWCSGGRAGLVVDAAAEAAGVSERTCSQVGAPLAGRGRGRAAGSLLGADGSWPTAPRSARSRRSRRCGGCGSPARRSPKLLGWPLSTVSGVLKRIGMGKLGRLGLEPAERYERDRPGELIHIDVKKLGRIQGGAGKRICGGGSHYNRTLHRRRRQPPQHRRLGLRPRRDRRRHPPGLRRSPRATRRPRPRSAFLRRAIAFFARHGITVERVMTDNGSPYRSTIHAHRLPRTAASATCAPAPTGPRPTAKPNASSAPCSTAGPTARSTAQARTHRRP